jgi:spermidine dehydrogenase
MSDPDRDAHRDHDAPRDRDLGLDRPIDRRDFLNGLAVGIGALGASSPGAWLRDGILDASAQDYPPARTGLRGSHDGAFEDAHRVRDRMAPKEWSTPSDLPERYDLVVVGPDLGAERGISTSSARETGARILIVDNHDDFGGHARRNEFTVDGTSIISYAGTQSIDTTSRYSPEAKGLLRTLGVDLQAFDTAYDQEFFETRGMKDAVFFDKETFGSDRLVLHNEGEPITAFLTRTPLSDAVKNEIARLYLARTDFLTGRSIPEKRALLARTSYATYLTQYCRLSRAAMPYFQAFTHDLFGVGIDAVAAGDCVPLELPGFAGLGLGDSPAPGMGRSAILHSSDEPYIHHFPDGNASIARLLVRRLIPGSIPGRTMHDIVPARVDYAALDRPAQRVRLRLSATAVHVQNSAGGVQVTYVRNGRAERVQARAASWRAGTPSSRHIVPETRRGRRPPCGMGPRCRCVKPSRCATEALEQLKTSSIFCPGRTSTTCRWTFR